MIGKSRVAPLRRLNMLILALIFESLGFSLVKHLKRSAFSNNISSRAWYTFTIGIVLPSVGHHGARSPDPRRTVLSHALLSYLFGAAIVGGWVNLIASLIC
jgi:hypothetical protein